MRLDHLISQAFGSLSPVALMWVLFIATGVTGLLSFPPGGVPKDVLGDAGEGDHVHPEDVDVTVGPWTPVGQRLGKRRDGEWGLGGLPLVGGRGVGGRRRRARRVRHRGR